LNPLRAFAFFAVLAVAACSPSSGRPLAGGPNTNLPPFGIPVYPHGVIPPAWQQAAWVVDPANASGCASDANATCGTASCGSAAGYADGPCASFAEIAGRWGTYEPRLQQTTTMTFISSHSSNADPVTLRPRMEKGAQFLLQGAGVTGTGLPTAYAASCVIGTVTAKNRGSNVPLSYTASATGGNCAVSPAATATPLLVVNATHASRAFITNNQLASSSQPTQPLSAITVTLGAGLGAPTEADTYASGDTVSYFQLPNVNLVDFEPQVVDFPHVNTAATLPPGILYQLNVFDPQTVTPNATAVFPDQVRISPAVTVVESSLQRVLTTPPGLDSGALALSTGTTAMGGLLANAYLPAGAFSVYSRHAAASKSVASLTMAGGAVGDSTACSAFYVAGWLFDFDATIGTCANGNAPDLTDTDLGCVFIDGSSVVSLRGVSFENGSNVNSNVPVIYGSASNPTLRLWHNAHVQYPAGASNAAATYKNMILNVSSSNTKACVVTPAGASSFGTCNLSTTAAQLDTSLGATSGCLCSGAGACFCNF
jgi:hypothetical protein